MTISLEAKKQIELRITKGSPQPIPSPTALPLKEIKVIEDVFQHRSGNQAASRSHVHELIKALKASQWKPFEPITIFWIGDAWVAIDGHHRHEAYSQAGYKGLVPVTVFVPRVTKGTTIEPLDAAIGQALMGNSRDKLSMGTREKSNGAWNLVIATSLSLAQLGEASGRSKTTIIDMRKAKEILEKTRPEIPLDSLTWEDARKVAQGKELEEHTYDDDWLEKEAQSLADALVTKHGPRLGKQYDVTWRALEIYHAPLVDYFKERLGIDPETGEPMEPEDLSEADF